MPIIGGSKTRTAGVDTSDSRTPGAPNASKGSRGAADTPDDGVPADAVAAPEADVGEKTEQGRVRLLPCTEPKSAELAVTDEEVKTQTRSSETETAVADAAASAAEEGPP